MKFFEKLKSRKFVLTLMIMGGASGLPILYKHMAIPDSITMLVVGIIGGVGVSYGVVNVMDRKIEVDK